MIKRPNKMFATPIEFAQTLFENIEKHNIPHNGINKWNLYLDGEGLVTYYSNDTDNFEGVWHSFYKETNEEICKYYLDVAEILKLEESMNKADCLSYLNRYKIKNILICKSNPYLSNPYSPEPYL